MIITDLLLRRQAWSWPARPKLLRHCWPASPDLNHKGIKLLLLLLPLC